MAKSKLEMRIECKAPGLLFKSRLYAGCICRALTGRDYEAYAVKAISEYVSKNIKMSGPYINA